MIRYYWYLFGLVALLFFTACSGDKGKKIPDVSHIEVSVPIIRFDSLLFSIDTTDILPALKQLEAQYPAFTDLYFTYILRYKAIQDTSDIYYGEVAGFIQDESIRELYHTCQEEFGDFSEQSAQFREAFRYLKYYFPDKMLPSIYTLISEYANQCFIFPESDERDGLGVGLDLFLGPDYPYRKLNPGLPNFSDYLTRSFNKDHLVKKTLEVWVEDQIGSEPGNRLLDLMIHNGKKIYILSHLLPFAPDSVILEYTPQQVDWCEENEFNIWAHLISEDLLYSTDRKKIQTLIRPSPYSAGMPQESPGRTANWAGWQIVKQFMQRYPDTDLNDLIALRDAQEILDKSKYKPRR